MLNKILTIDEKELEKYRINPNDYLNKQQEQSTKETQTQPKTEQKEENMETKNEQKTEFKQFDTNRIPESEYQKYGIKPENVEGELKAMSYGYNKYILTQRKKHYYLCTSGSDMRERFNTLKTIH